MGRTRWLIAFAVLLAGVCAAPVLAAPGSGGSAHSSVIGDTRVAISDATAVSGQPAPDDETAPSEGPEEESAPTPESPIEETPGEEAGVRPGIERDQALETPEAKAEREQSQLAYTDLAPEQTEDLLRESFAPQLKQLDADPSRALADVAIESVTSPTEAIVEVEGERSLLESTVPIRVPDENGELAKVDLSLEQTESGFVPKNALADVSLPATASGAIEVGDIALTLAANGEQPAAKAEASEARTFGEEDLVLPEVAEDTSLLLSPVTGGVELSTLVASRRSPEQLSFAVTMPEGAQLRATSDGGAEVVGVDEKGEPLARIGVPFAVDAQGAIVPVSLLVKENTIILAFPHRSLDIAYPLFIDPEIEENWWGFADTSKLNYWAWQYSGVGPEDYIGWRSPIVTSWGNGLYVRARNNFGYPAGSYGRWWFVPQGSTTYMRRVIFGPMHMDPHVNPSNPQNCWNNEPHGYAGVWNNGGFWSVHAPAYPTSVATWVDTGEQNLGAGARTAFVAMHADSGANLKCGRDYAMNGAVLYLNDPENPSVSANGYPTTWLKDKQSFTLNVPVYDPGLGVKSATVSPKDAPPLPTKELGCTGHYNSPCPANNTFQWTVSADSYDQGEKEVQVSAKDAMAKTSSTFAFTMKVDRTPPDITLGGQLATATDEAEGEAKDETGVDPLHLPVYNLTIKAEDGVENGTAAQRRSGVKSIEVFLDNESTPRESWSQGACANSCGMTKTFTLKLNELTALTHHSLKVVVKDHAGNTPREREIEFEYVPATGMKEEYVLHRFALPNGQGDEEAEEDPIRPELAVNVMNGNLVYRQLDAEVAGPGADLEVERTYNSLLPESQDTQWGDGWTLAQTPTLETEGAKGSPDEATLVDESGSVESQVDLPAHVGEERFDDQLQAVISKEVTGYAITDESGEGDGTVVFNESGVATELEISEYAGVEYGYDAAGMLSEMSVDDPASAGGTAEQAAEREALEDIDPTYQSTFGSHGAANGQFGVLNDIAIDPTDGTLWVSDDENDRIQHFTAAGEYLGKFASCYDPGAVEVDSAGNVIVACSSAHIIRKFSDTGATLKTISTFGKGDGQTYFPLDLDLDSAGNLWVADTENNRVIEFDPSGAFVDDFGTGTLVRPKGIAVAPNGDIWVAESNQQRVSVLDPDGDLRFRFGGQGSGDGQFAHPSDVEVDGHGYAWVADAVNDRVQVFNKRGEFVTRFGTSGTGPGQINTDWWLRLAIDATGNVFVTDEGNSRVERWSSPKRLLVTSGATLQDDPSLEVAVDGGLVSAVEGDEVGEIAYEHDDQLLTAVDGPEGETSYEYDGNERMTKVTLPNGTYAEIAYEATYGRVKSVTVSIEGGSPKTTHFNYEDQPQRKTTVAPPAPDPVTTYEFAADGSMFKWWNTAAPPTIDDVGGTLHDVEQRETDSPIAPGLYNLTVQASSAHGVASIQIVANNNTLVSEKTCEQIPGEPVECPKETDEWVLETGSFAPGILYLEVIATNALGEMSSERFWVNIPYTPPPDPEAEDPPKFSDVLSFREKFGLDLDVKGDEEAINDRVFNLIGDWNNPHTPSGEVARSTAARWSVPLRSTDAAEMEFRQAYIDHDSLAVEEWAEAHYPGTYAGYFVDHQAGGIAHIGFTQQQAQRVAEIKQQVDLLAPDSRVEPYSTVPTVAKMSLETASETISAALESNATLRGLVAEVELNEVSNEVEVGASNVGQAESLLNQIVGSQVPVSVHYQPVGVVRTSGRLRGSGRILAGDRLITERVVGEVGACTSGFGARETRTEKSTGEEIVARFLLTSGHCGYLGSITARSAFPNGADLKEVGPVNRNAFTGGGWRTDALAVRVAGGLAPNEIYRKGMQPLGVGAPTRAKRTNVLCFSGLKTDHRECGEVIGRPEVVEPGFREFNYLVDMKTEPTDSGAPVWNPRSEAAVGLIIGHPGGYPNLTLVAPLLPMLHKSVLRVPGALKALSLPDPKKPELQLIVKH